MPSLSKRSFLDVSRRALVAALVLPLTPLVNGMRIPTSNARDSTRADPDFEPGYLTLHRSGELKARGEALWAMMGDCALCPRPFDCRCPERPAETL